MSLEVFGFFSLLALEVWQFFSCVVQGVSFRKLDPDDSLG
jgi:hypothetical protein